MKNITNFILEQMNDTIQKVQYKLSNNQDMIINGSISKVETNKLNAICKKAGYELITLYTDKMQPDDFASVLTNKGDAVPQWVDTIVQNPNKKYLLLLVFDNIDNKLINAAMPLFLNHEIMGKKTKNMNWCIATTDVDNIVKPVLSRAGGERDIIEL